MCGIVGFTGSKQALDMLLEGLGNLEYRGYDSAGVSVFCGGAIRTVKAQGRLQNLREKLACYPLEGTCGIGHTRWATHGEPSDQNAHPHTTEKLSLVHNGIIENYLELRAELSQKGYSFVSQTDTEVAAKVLDSCYDGDPAAAIRKASSLLEGAFAFGVLFADRPGEVYAIRRGSPLIVALSEEGNFITSDVTAVLRHTHRYFTLEAEEIVRLTPEGATVWGPDGGTVEKTILTASWSVEQAQKSGYPHFMLKEIYEQPEALKNTVHPRVLSGLPSFEADGIPDGFFQGFDRVQVIACGTAMHAGMVGRMVIEKLARLPVDVDIASEFRYRDPILTPRHLVVVVSQSGETADTLAALRLAKERGCPVLAIVNVAGSTIAREADHVLYTYAGPEIAVASTKAYSVQLGIFYLLGIRIALEKGRIEAGEARSLTAELLETIGKTVRCLELSPALLEIARDYQEIRSLFFIGRGFDYPLCCEGSLKLKEISYIHCEAYAAGELKHGTISLVTPGVPVVALATQTALLPKTVSNIKEVQARGARVLLICRESAAADPGVYAHRVSLPDASDLFMPLLSVIPLQLLSYHAAVLRGCDVDKPRNLAKSVTVE
ncbi:MAG: glutamine--fructose-6-phosphate transaminase (isomerizing) [Oscillospiraceae bacterium]|nr:glutamine--fructose-6-phosphate transaminase (isomerizing) [Oscillospiraceae bacterium]